MRRRNPRFDSFSDRNLVEILRERALPSTPFSKPRNEKPKLIEKKSPIFIGETAESRRRRFVTKTPKASTQRNTPPTERRIVLPPNTYHPLPPLENPLGIRKVKLPPHLMTKEE